MINFRQHEEGEVSFIQQLFTSVFADSEGQPEGLLIGNLALELATDADRRNIYCFVAEQGDQILGAIFFSRLTFASDVPVFILAPVAVDTNHQGQGIGQNLIKHGLAELKKTGVKVAITYGDPAFYSKVGFLPLSQNTIPAPHTLSQPEGWLGQSLDGSCIETILGHCSCVKALNNPVYW